jgi:hypothetical protein
MMGVEKQCDARGKKYFFLGDGGGKNLSFSNRNRDPWSAHLKYITKVEFYKGQYSSLHTEACHINFVYHDNTQLLIDNK